MQTENTYVETDLGNIALNPRGEYLDEVSYEYLDTVSYKGGSYVCLAELTKTISGIAPAQGKNTEHWQMLTLPGQLTPEAVAMHDDVVNKAKQVETSRAAVELSQQEIEAAQADVTQMRQDTQEASEEAIASRDSAAGYAQSAEISRTAAKESEDNVKAQESKVVQSVINEGTKQIKAVSDKAREQIGAVNTTGSTQVSIIETKGADQVEAIQEACENALQNISDGVDKGLSEEGKAADAKATGEAISKLTEDTAVLQKRQNVLVGSETGNPVSCDDAYSAPLCGLTVYGRSTQDGTPTPDAPVPIVSAGDGGSVAVRLTGANMLEGTKAGAKSTVNGITYTIDENGVLITGTATKTFSIILHEDVKYRLTRGIYYMTTRGLSPSIILNFFFIGKFSSDIQNHKVTLTRDADFSLTLQILGGATLNTTVQVSLARNKITTYAPYREQLLTLPTPNGLPGIPVTSGGNYTDQSGQQWACDEVDLKRGVKVQRVDKAAFDSTKALAEQNAILTTPIETPLTPAEIAAYKALTAYGPDMVVQAGDGAGVRLDYQRDVNIAIKRIEDAVASMT